MNAYQPRPGAFWPGKSFAPPDVKVTFLKASCDSRYVKGELRVDGRAGKYVVGAAVEIRAFASEWVPVSR